MADTQNKIGDVLVVGGGISGIQASLDLANSGFKVFLVDDDLAIGGKMAKLDKTFPTNDCSMCIESPKFIECARNPNIEIITYCDIDHVEGEAGKFSVTLLKKPRYVVEENCTGCGTCTRFCPVKIPDDFNQGMSLVKCAHVYFPQAVPAVTTIAEGDCHYLKEGTCQICVPVCKNKAIRFDQKEEKIELQVGAVILAVGYQPFDPRPRHDYGYGKLKNVVTSLEYERILSASGPYGGEILRPSDRKHAKKIAWIQCVGSRQVTPGGNCYCSAVCCMYAMKQMILSKDHDENIEITIFHNDIRSYGKEFEQYYKRARNLQGVRFIRSYVSLGREVPENNNVTIRYSQETGGVKEDEFDLVVLSVGLTFPESAHKLAQKFSVELDQHGFCRTDISNAMQTTRPGVFVCGAFSGPKDIPESVTQGSGAAALCGELLSDRRSKLSETRVFPAEKDVSVEEPRVGVFVCHCGTNIAGVVDVPAVVNYASTLDNVAHAEPNLFSCSADNARHITEVIKEKGLNRVVVAACTPRTHEPLFQDTLCEAGINKYLFDMAPIREHCSWVHSRERGKATEKAKDIVRMSVARSIHLQPQKEFEVPICKKGLVLGGGLAGMTSALSLAKQGFEVYLVEKNAGLGGMARRLSHTLEGMDVPAYLNGLNIMVLKNQLIHVYTNAEIVAASGFAGSFDTTLIRNGKTESLHHGVAIIATGAEEYKPVEYSYGQDQRVLTLLELEERIAAEDAKLKQLKSLAMVLCVGSRNDTRPQCSRVCCNQAIKCALKLKDINPEMEIYIMFRDMRTYGFQEGYYRKAADRGVKFIRYDLNNKPELVIEGETLKMIVMDQVLGKKLSVDVDMLALGVAVVPPASNSRISELFKVPLSQDGFFLEAHAKLRPVDFAADGIFVCGTAHFPKTISEAVAQAYASASRAVTIISKDLAVSSGAIASVNEDNCIGCGICESLCPYGAIKVGDTPRGQKASVAPLVCKGCGMCSSKCPTCAITPRHFESSQIIAQIGAAFARQAAAAKV